MGENANANNSNEVEVVRKENDLIELTEGMLQDARATINSKNTLSIPIAELSTLGAGVSSLVPALNTVTQTTTFATEGLYRLANAGVGDVLKVAKNGNYWGAFKTADGASKFAQLQTAGPLSATSTTVAAINPATIMMAVALFSIEKELGKIAEMGKQILLFLEVEKESEIEADVETLMNIVTKYKLNWDNEHFVTSNHKLVLDIQRTARKNMNAYQKKVNEVLKSKHFIVAQNKVNSIFADLEKKFKYYRLSLYTFSLASLMEIMLSGNFKEEYITGIKDEIRTMSHTYRELFEKCSISLEKMSTLALEANVVKGLGTASEVVGKFIGNIPLVKNGQVDEILQDKGEHLQKNAIGMENKAVRAFAAIGNPGTGAIIEKMKDMVQIFNHTSQICFDKEKIYLVAN
jgi:hypothetical protein